MSNNGEISYVHGISQENNLAETIVF